jgi:hypothetical protein
MSQQVDVVTELDGALAVRMQPLQLVRHFAADHQQ